MGCSKESAFATSQRKKEKDVAIIAVEFLFQETSNKHISRRNKDLILEAIKCMTQVFALKLLDIIALRRLPNLSKIANVGYNPVRVKDRLAAEVCKKRGNMYILLDQFERAEKEYTKAVRLDSRNAVYFCNRAVSRLRQELYVGALKDCRQALNLDPTYVKAHAWMGMTYSLMDNPRKALAAYTSALKIEPDNQICLYNVIEINRRHNRLVLGILGGLFCSCSQTSSFRSRRRRSEQPLLEDSEEDGGYKSDMLD